MPGENDIQVLRAFVQETLRTYEIVAADGRTARVPERELLRSALLEITREGQDERIVSQYAGTDDDRLRDAGLLGQQLASKRELARLASEDLVVHEETARPSRRRFSRPRIRRWIKRCKVLVGSLKGLIPGAEALNELLDALDAALDRG